MLIGWGLGENEQKCLEGGMGCGGVGSCTPDAPVQVRRRLAEWPKAPHKGYCLWLLLAPTAIASSLS